MVCPLNWGLGHATRCSPIIDALISRGHQVHLASDGLAAILLARHYPDLPLYTLGELDIRYSKRFWWSLFKQVFPILKWLQTDRQNVVWLHRRHDFDLIISDSRVTCRLSTIPSILIISQSSPILPLGLQWGFTKMLHWLLKRFDRIWIPDLPSSDDQLSGKLIDLPPNQLSNYIGLLTRLVTTLPNASDGKPKKILGLLSGPEPARTEFEKQLLALLDPDESIIVGGRPDRTKIQDHYVSYVDPATLSALLSSANYVICRAGYSSLMDLAAFSKKLILVPTPGQTEQLYLAQRLVSKNEAVLWDMAAESWSTVKSRADQAHAFYRKNDSQLLTSALDEIEKYCQKKITFRS